MFFKIINQSTALAAELISIDKKLLDTSLLGIFKPKKYEEYHAALIDISNSLSRLIDTTKFCEDEALEALHNHLKSLLLLSECLIEINDGLNKKSYGGYYSSSSFKSGLANLERAKISCTTTQLNNNLKAIL